MSCSRESLIILKDGSQRRKLCCPTLSQVKAVYKTANVFRGGWNLHYRPVSRLSTLYRIQEEKSVAYLVQS